MKKPKEKTRTFVFNRYFIYRVGHIYGIQKYHCLLCGKELTRFLGLSSAPARIEIKVKPSKTRGYHELRTSSYGCSVYVDGVHMRVLSGLTAFVKKEFPHLEVLFFKIKVLSKKESNEKEKRKDTHLCA